MSFNNYYLPSGNPNSAGTMPGINMGGATSSPFAELMQNPESVQLLSQMLQDPTVRAKLHLPQPNQTSQRPDIVESGFNSVGGSNLNRNIATPNNIMWTKREQGDKLPSPPIGFCTTGDVANLSATPQVAATASSVNLNSANNIPPNMPKMFQEFQQYMMAKQFADSLNSAQETYQLVIPATSTKQAQPDQLPQPPPFFPPPLPFEVLKSQVNSTNPNLGQINNEMSNVGSKAAGGNLGRGDDSNEESSASWSAPSRKRGASDSFDSFFKDPAQSQSMSPFTFSAKINNMKQSNGNGSTITVKNETGSGGFKNSNWNNNIAQESMLTSPKSASSNNSMSSSEIFACFKQSLNGPPPSVNSTSSLSKLAVYDDEISKVVNPTVKSPVGRMNNRPNDQIMFGSNISKVSNTVVPEVRRTEYLVSVTENFGATKSAIPRTGSHRRANVYSRNPFAQSVSVKQEWGVPGQTVWSKPPPQKTKPPFKPISRSNDSFSRSFMASTSVESSFATKPTAFSWSQPFENDNDKYESLISCDPCNKVFWTKKSLEEHKLEHSKCPHPGCSFSANEEAVETHFANTHARGIHLKLDTPEDIRKWREERKKKFPTKQNVEMKIKTKMVRESRGETIETMSYSNCKPRGNYQNSQQQQPGNKNSDAMTVKQEVKNNAGFARNPRLTSRQR